MKRVISLVLALIMILSMAPAVYGASSEAVAAADTLYALGLFAGTGKNPDGTPIYTLDRAPTRQEAITILVQILGKKEEALNGTWEMPFTDVASWAKPFVGYAYANGLTSGTGATTFGGNDLVTASQYLTFILKALNYEVGTDFQWNKAWELSDKIGMTHGEYNAATKTFLRGDVTKISAAALSQKLKGQDKLMIQSLVEAGAVDGETAMDCGLDAYGLTSKVHFIYDIRTFTLYAFMNYTGYDDNNNRPITGTRQALRNELDSMDITISNPNYYNTKGAREYQYAAALKYLGEAPTFDYYDTRESAVQKLNDLPEKLEEFYAAADIPSLYEKYREDHEVILRQYKEALPDIVQMVGYFDEENNVDGEFGIEVVLLDAWNRGTGLGSPDQYYGYGVIRTGPEEGVNVLNILHEYAHGFVNRAIDENQSQMKKLSNHFNRNCVAVTKQGYDTWEKIVDESFVRAISLYFDSSRDENRKKLVIADEMAQGFVMTEYVYNRIPEFETYQATFTDFVGMLFEEYK